MNELEKYLSGKTETSKNPIVGLETDMVKIGNCINRQMHILLIYPSATIPKYMQKRCVPPIGLLYLASSLEKAGHRVTVLDCLQEGYDNELEHDNFITYGLEGEKLRKRLLEIQFPDIVGLTVPFSIDIEKSINVSKIIKQVFKDTICVVGGLHPTIYPKDIFEADNNDCIDYILRGEGEKNIVEFVKCVKHGEINKNMSGLVGAFNNEFVVNDQVDRIEDLDSLPFPSYHLLPMHRYFDINMPFSPVPKGQRVVPILTTRGCPIGCSFCASTNMYKKHYCRSVDNILEEIKILKNTYNIDEIQFMDDNLTLNNDRFKKLMDGMRELGLYWCTPNGVMINTMTPELIKKMKETGLYQITLSVDSMSANVSNNFKHKPVDLDRVPSLIQSAEDCGVFTHGTLVIGMPGETIESIKVGLDFVLDNLMFTSISAFIASPIPGSELYHNCLDSGFVKNKKDAWETNTSRMDMFTGINTKELEKVVMNFQNNFTLKAKKRNPEVYDKKYKKLIEKGLMKKSLKSGGRLT